MRSIRQLAEATAYIIIICGILWFSTQKFFNSQRLFQPSTIILNKANYEYKKSELTRQIYLGIVFDDISKDLLKEVDYDPIEIKKVDLKKIRSISPNATQDVLDAAYYGLMGRTLYGLEQIGFDLPVQGNDLKEITRRANSTLDELIAKDIDIDQVQIIINSVRPIPLNN